MASLRNLVHESHERALDRYRARVAPQPHVSIAESLLVLWDRPWSSTALRFAYHACTTAYRKLGISVLEATSL